MKFLLRYDMNRTPVEIDNRNFAGSALNHLLLIMGKRISSDTNPGIVIRKSTPSGCSRNTSAASHDL